MSPFPYYTQVTKNSGHGQWHLVLEESRCSMCGESEENLVRHRIVDDVARVSRDGVVSLVGQTFTKFRRRVQKGFFADS